MKKTLYILVASVAVLVVTSLFYSCKKTHDSPPVTINKDALTIAEIRTMYNGSNIKFTQDISLYATVTMTDNYKTLYLRDNTGSIMLRQLNAHGIYEGDSLRVNLNGSTLDLSSLNSSLQIDSVDVSSSSTNKVVKLGYGIPHSPVQVSIAQLQSSLTSTVYPNGTVLPISKYDAELIQVNDVQFSPIVKTSNTGGPNGLYIDLNTTDVYVKNLYIYDCGMLNKIGFSLYTGTTDFLYKHIPLNNSGSAIGAATLYGGAIQFTPRSYNDMMLNQPRCGVDALYQPFTGATSSTFTTSFPGWGDWNTAGTVVWTGGTQYATGAPGTTSSRNEMWLVSPAIQNSSTKTLSFYMSMANLSLGAPNQLSVLVSKDYQIDSTSGKPNLGGNYAGASSTMPSNATWYDITSSFTMRTGSTPASTGTVTLSSTAAGSILNGYNGLFYIAFRYRGNPSISDSTQTVNINNVSIQN